MGQTSNACTNYTPKRSAGLDHGERAGVTQLRAVGGGKTVEAAKLRNSISVDFGAGHCHCCCDVAKGIEGTWQVVRSRLGA